MCVMTALLLGLSMICGFLFCRFDATSPKASWLPGVPPPPPRFRTHFLLGHLKHFATARPKKSGGIPDKIGSMAELFTVGRTKASDSGLTAFKFMRQPAICAIRGEHVRALIVASNQRDAIRFRAGHMERLLGKLSLALMDTTDPALWKTHRKLVSRGFFAENLRRMVPEMDKVWHTLHDSLRWSGAASEKGVSLDLLRTVKLATLDIIGTCAFGARFECCEGLEFSTCSCPPPSLL